VRFLREIADPMECIRSVILSYFNACDVPRFDFDGDYAKLFTTDAIWEGIGDRYTSKFGRLEGRAVIVSALGDVLSARDGFKFNHHLLSNELLRNVSSDQAAGSWSMTQLSTAATGESTWSLSRIEVDFRIENSAWRIAHFRTRNLCVKNVPGGWTDDLIPL
jgi:hypothetical protein